MTLGDIEYALRDAPREICCEVNDWCNLNCPICIANATTRQGHNLSPSLFEHMIRDLDGVVRRVTLTGGEPILHPCFDEFVTIASKYGKGIVVATNGYLPSPLTTALRDLRGLTVTVSIHGTQAVHDRFVGRCGAYERAIETVELCISGEHRVEVLTIASCEAIGTLPELTNCLNDLAISEHRINMVRQRGRIGLEPAHWEEIVSVASRLHPPYKLSVKRRDQPYMFVGCDGKKEYRNGRS